MSDDARLIGQVLVYAILTGFAGLVGWMVLRELREARAWRRTERRISQIGVDQRTRVVERLERR